MADTLHNPTVKSVPLSSAPTYLIGVEGDPSLTTSYQELKGVTICEAANFATTACVSDEADLTAALADTSITKVLFIEDVTLAVNHRIPSDVQVAVRPGVLLTVNSTLILDSFPAEPSQHIFNKDSTGEIIGSFGEGVLHTGWFGISGEGIYSDFVSGVATARNGIKAGGKIFLSSSVDQTPVNEPITVTASDGLTFTAPTVPNGNHLWWRVYDEEMALLRQCHSNNEATGIKEIKIQFPSGNFGFTEAWDFRSASDVVHGNVQIAGSGTQATRFYFNGSGWADDSAAIELGGTSISNIQFATTLKEFFMQVSNIADRNIDGIRLGLMGEGSWMRGLWVTGGFRRAISFTSVTYGFVVDHCHLIIPGLTASSVGIRTGGLYSSLSNGTINGSQSTLTYYNGRPVSISGTNVTYTDHGLAVGERVFLAFHDGNQKGTATVDAAWAASNLPQDGTRGVTDELFVVSVPDANTITLSATSGGAAISFTNPTGLGIKAMHRYIEKAIELTASFVSATDIAGWNIQHSKDCIDISHQADIRRVLAYNCFRTVLKVSSSTNRGVRAAMMTHDNTEEGSSPTYLVNDLLATITRAGGGNPVDNFEYHRSVGNVLIVDV